ncbi:Mobile element protein [Caballeronia sordidicola]|uniref:Mobile element protein n=1 Tax=Caballeronia sordidicola TaxID=196367 RepID=A0A242MDC5_CABSO|nr:Mobile element protein [Caballeronia sordidicola]
MSRQTGYKWLNRYKKDGIAGLADQSRRPLDSPSITPPALEQPVLGVRTRNPAWGAQDRPAPARSDAGAAAGHQHDCRDPASPR